MANQRASKTLATLVAGAVGAERCGWILERVNLPDFLSDDYQEKIVPRATLAFALNLVLFSDLLGRVPSARRWVDDQFESGIRQRFDHGAIRTIRFPDGPTGELPGGIDAFARILLPLGYEIAATYPLPRLAMTGYAFRHFDAAEDIPQFFVSELHVDRFPPGFVAAADRVFSSSHDPVDTRARLLLSKLESDEGLPMDAALALVPIIASAFARMHRAPSLVDYSTLLALSAEAAWIATEGNVFNHATDRVDDVIETTRRLVQDGYEIKKAVEHSACGRVHQTALLADPVNRIFREPCGQQTQCSVPGSFYEFITRDTDPNTGRIELAFDSGNATGIFAVTRMGG